MAFVDYQKAFDLLHRNYLWYKLIKTSISGNLYNVIRSMYTHVRSRVKCFDGTVPEMFETFMDVRQGENLSSFLFNIFLNDIETALIESGVQGVYFGEFKMYLLL